MPGELAEFIAAAKGRGASDPALVALLRQRGWSEKAVYDALASYYEAQTGLTVPSPRAASESAREAFLYLLSFATLATWACALGSLLFTIIERAFPDSVVSQNYSAYYADYSISTEIAALAVAFPIYLLAMRFILRSTGDVPEALESRVRAWLTWLALFLTAGIVVGDLITFLAYFLRGELSLRFTLKVLVVLVIAGTIFWYYLSSLRRLPRRHTVLAGIATVVVASAIVVGNAHLGSRDRQRNLQADQRRIQHLGYIQSEVSAAWRRNEALPASAGERFKDPVTGAAYPYRPGPGSKYELCATFAAPGPEWEQQWPHNAGLTCFTRDASKP
jgi:hypothetical protein